MELVALALKLNLFSSKFLTTSKEKKNKNPIVLQAGWFRWNDVGKFYILL